MSGPLAHLRDLLDRDELEPALRSLIEFVGGIAANSKLAGTTFPFPQLDDICAEIGARSAFDLLAPPAMQNADHWDGEHDVVLLTEAFVQGGHAEIIRDIVAWGDHRVVLACSNLYDRRRPVLPDIAADPRVCVLALDGADLLERLRRLQAVVAHPAVRRVLVLCHAHDAVCIAAAATVINRPVLFFHHCDHTPCLGCFLRRAVHVDLHNLGVAHCRHELGITPHYVCLTSGAPARGPEREADADADTDRQRFQSITCGNEHKLSRLAYPITYADVVARVVAVHGGIHYHVGLLSDAFLHHLREALGAAGLPADAFVHVGHVGRFRDIVEALEIDLYVPTLPQAGGKALVDAMSAGVPVLVHENAIDRLWGGRDLVYPEAPSWANLGQLETCLRRFAAPAYRRQQRAASLLHFTRHHTPALFQAMLAGAPGAPPPLQPYRPDLDQRLLAGGMAE